jgi:hypothetical protein
LNVLFVCLIFQQMFSISAWQKVFNSISILLEGF